MSEGQKIPDDEKIESEKLNEPIPSEENKVQPVNEPSITIKQQVTPGSMEVHHHPDLHHKKKYWKEYFLEFLMIFLAVTLGFFSENIREYFVDTSREKEFMVSLVKDLELDTSQFSRIRVYKTDKLRMMDSLIIFFYSHNGSSVPANEYTIGTGLFGSRGFYQNSGTLDQLKNSGGLRLIRHRNVVDSVESYDQQVKRIALRDQFEANYSGDNYKLLQKLFDGKLLLKIFADTTYFNKPISPLASVALNEQFLDEYLNNLRGYQSLVKLDMELHATVKEKATQLIILIKKEYKLEEDE